MIHNRASSVADRAVTGACVHLFDWLVDGQHIRRCAAMTPAVVLGHDDDDDDDDG